MHAQAKFSVKTDGGLWGKAGGEHSAGESTAAGVQVTVNSRGVVEATAQNADAPASKAPPPRRKKKDAASAPAPAPDSATVPAATRSPPKKSSVPTIPKKSGSPPVIPKKAAPAPAPARMPKVEPKRYKCLKRAVLRAGFEMDSDKLVRQIARGMPSLCVGVAHTLLASGIDL